MNYRKLIFDFLCVTRETFVDKNQIFLEINTSKADIYRNQYIESNISNPIYQKPTLLRYCLYR